MRERERQTAERVYDRLTATPLRIAAGLYALLCVPGYVWLEGPVGTTGTVASTTAFVSLLAGSVLVVPLLTYFVNQRFSRGGLA